MACKWVHQPDHRLCKRMSDIGGGGRWVGFAVLLKFHTHEDRFPRYKYEVTKVVIAHIAGDLGLSPELFKAYPWKGRTIKLHRAQIRRQLGFRPAREEDVPGFVQWLLDEVLLRRRAGELRGCHEWLSRVAARSLLPLTAASLPLGLLAFTGESATSALRHVVGHDVCLGRVECRQTEGVEVARRIQIPIPRPLPEFARIVRPGK